MGGGEGGGGAADRRRLREGVRLRVEVYNHFLAGKSVSAVLSNYPSSSSFQMVSSACIHD